ncbi:terminase large subunit domain-containing protein [Klebsiella variicola]|uniref:terminase large subunit domain-containing protein n=1 Tax=Klebsiella variicola TaxID=244366 RepID=UPI001D11A9D4|nr:terminase large subunit [Klebsiella variicola]
MATYPNVNAANQYARDIVGGKILACQLTILACQRHLDDLERAKDPHWPYRFDKNKAERFLRFAQKMPHTSGEWARRKLRIEFEAWQKFALGVPFGWVHKKTGLRRFSEIYIEVPRKNGKSAIAAAVGNYMFCADGEHGAEVYCGATTEKQAWKVFSPALQMVKKLPALRQKFSIKPWAKKMTRPDGSVFAPVIGDPGDGDSPSCAIIDEYHEHTTDALYTTMTTGNGKNVGAGITLGSNGETSDMILYADRFSLFNRNNATAVPVMIAEGNELYIDTARIKNSSLTSTKIADGSITNAKIGNVIQSNDYVDGSRGWSINKDGGAQFNNGIFRGHIEAASGKFKGTLEAQSFIGDIAVARRYDDMAFRRNQTVQRNGAYQNRGYGMTIVLSCTLVYHLTGAGNVQQSYSVDITFNIGGQEVTRRFFANAGGFQAGDFTQEFRFAADLLADNNNVSFFIKARGNDASIDYSCSIQNITATAFRTNSNSFS